MKITRKSWPYKQTWGDMKFNLYKKTAKLHIAIHNRIHADTINIIKTPTLILSKLSKLSRPPTFLLIYPTGSGLTSEKCIPINKKAYWIETMLLHYRQAVKAKVAICFDK